MIKTSRFRLSPSIVEQKDLLEKTFAALEKYPVVFLKGAPLIGKSTFLTQVAVRAEQNSIVHFVELRHEMDLSSALHKIYSELTSGEIAKSGDALGLEDEVLKILDRAGIILIVDNFDHIREGGKFFEFLVKNLRTGKVVASGVEIPKIDPLLAMDFKSLNLTGLSKSELEHLLKYSIAADNSEKRESLIQKLFASTSGNPFLVKLVLSAAILEQRLLEESDVENNIEKAKRSYLEKIFESLDEESKERVVQASLIRYADLVESDILRELPENILSDLIAVGFCSEKAGRVLLSTSAQEFSLSQIRQTAHIRGKITELVSSRKDIESRKEFVFQSIQLGKYENAARVFEIIAQDLLRNGEMTNIADLSAPIFKSISAEAFNVRHWAIVKTPNSHQLLDECYERLEVAKSNKEIFQLKVIVSSILGVRGEFQRSVQVMREALQYEIDDVDLKTEGLTVLARYLGYQERDQALEILQQVEKSSKLNFNSSNYLLGQFHLTYALTNLKFANQQAALEQYQKAADCFRQSGHKGFELGCRSGIASCKYDLGLIREALFENAEILEAAEKFSLTTTAVNCLCLRGRHLIHRGDLIEAKRVFSKVLERSSNSGSSAFKYALADLAWIDVKESNYPGSFEKLSLLLTNESVKSTQSEFPRLQHLKMAAELALGGNLDSISVEDSSLNYEDIVFCEIVQLEVIWSKQFVAKSTKILDLPDISSRNDVSIPYKHIRNCLIALNKLILGEVILSEKLLNQSLKFFRSSDLILFEFRSLLGLIIVDLHFGRSSSALQKIEDANVLAKSIQGFKDEINLLRFVTIVCELRRGKQNLFDINLALKGSGFESLLAIMNTNKFNLDGTQELTKFQEYLVSILKLSAVSKVKVKTKKLDYIGYESKLSILKEEKFDLILREQERTIIIGRLKIGMMNREVLFDLLRWFLLKPTEKFSKEELTVQVWHEKYNPLVHDTRIYTSIRRLRELVRLKIEVIETDAGRYYLNPSINFAVISSAENDNFLNARQSWILKFIENNESIDRVTAQKLLKVGGTVIKLDLRNMINRGYLKLVGRGKSSRYFRA